MLAVQIRDPHATVLLQLVYRAHANRAACHIIDPDRQRRAPHPVTRHRPINGAVQPLTKTAFLDMLRHPVDLGIRLHQLVFDRRYSNVPRGNRSINQGRV